MAMPYSLIAPKVLKYVGALIALALLSSCKPTYTAAPIRGKVIDAVTRQPIAGANILVAWPVYSGTHSHFVGNVEVKEAVSNENGEFLIDGWGPKKNISMAPMTDEVPSMLIFKPWYYVKGLSNHLPGWTKAYAQDAPEYLVSFWDNKTIELEPADEREKYIASLSGFESSIESHLSGVYSGKACDWAKWPKMILSVSRFLNRLFIEGYRKKPTLDISRIRINQGCPSLESVFGERYE